MNALFLVTIVSTMLITVLRAEDTTHHDAAANVANQQDELAADVQQLVIEQTVPQVIKLLNEVGEIMDEVTDQLAESNTGGDTIAAQTEVIEKIHAAAKEKQKQDGGSESGSAMMDMVERMMGKNPDGEQKPGGKEGKEGKEGDQAGQGNGGNSDTPNDVSGGPGDGKNEARRVPKSSGSKNSALPEEFRDVLDAYNRGAEQKVR